MKPQMEPKIKPASLIAGYQSKNHPFPVSIDKLSLVGFLKKDFSLPDWEARNMDVGERFTGGKQYRYSWKTDDYFLQCEPFSKEHDIRLEFNPNNVTYSPSLLAIIKSLIHAKLTRIDLAVDYIDNLILSEYFVNCLDKSKATYEARNKNITGWTLGSSNSESLYRVYDKKAQMKSVKDQEIECNSWWRVEMQIRPKNDKNWFEYSPFEDLQIAKENYPSENPIDEAVLRCIINDTRYISRLSKHHRMKYKRMLKSEYCLDSLSLEDHPYYVIKHARTWLDDQITSFLNRP